MADGRPPAVGEHLPARSPVGAPAGVDRHDDALGTELVGDLGDELRAVDRRGVHADLVRSRTQHPAGVLDAADAATHGEGDEHLLRDVAHHLDGGVPTVRRRGDVEEDQLVGTFLVVAGGQFDGVARVAQLDEVDALDDATGVHVEAGDDPGDVHDRPPPQAATPSATVKAPS